MIDVLPVGKWTPKQALLQALSEADDMDVVAVVCMKDGVESAHLTCSAISPIELHFLGTALTMYAQDMDE